MTPEALVTEFAARLQKIRASFVWVNNGKLCHGKLCALVCANELLIDIEAQLVAIGPHDQIDCRFGMPRVDGQRTPSMRSVGIARRSHAMLARKRAHVVAVCRMLTKYRGLTAGRVGLNVNRISKADY